MREDICSVPVSEVFEISDGCPMCRMRNIIEQRLLDYIRGAAMMEPDVRIMTNKEGFCHRHFRMMASRHSRLPLALIIESHLAEVKKDVFGAGAVLKPSSKGKSARAQKKAQSCFICSRIEKAMGPLTETIVRLYCQQMEFREMFRKSEELCLEHYSSLAAETERSCDRRYKSEMQKEASYLAQNALQKLENDINHFCSMFDYRNNTEDADWKDSKDAIERSIQWLTGLDPQDKSF